MSFNQMCPGYWTLSVILFKEKMQEIYFYFAILGQFMNMPFDPKFQGHLPVLVLQIYA